MGRLLLLLSILFIASSVSAAGTLTSMLTWTNPDANDGIQIEKAASCSGTFAMLKQVPAGTSTYTDATNSGGDTPCYRLAYFNSSGLGAYSVTAGKSFPQIPAQVPAGLVVQ